MSGKFLNERCHELILNVFDYFCRERDNSGLLCSVGAPHARAAKALNISGPTLKKIIDSKKMNVPLPKTLQKPRKKLKTDDVSEGLQHAIRDVIYSKYAEKRVVTLETLRKTLEEKELIVASRPTIDIILNNIGFKYKKDCNRRALCEKTNVASARVRFLKEYVQNKNSPSPLLAVFLDETWVFARGSHKRSWQDDTPKTVKNSNCSSNGKRFMILHAGNQDGFIENSSLIFSTTSKSSDYHDNMDATNFENWLKNQLLLNLQEPSLIVMDNTGYHSRLVEKRPNSYWKKEDIQMWLTRKNISFCSTDLKTDLLTLAKQYKYEKQFVVDNIIKKHGHFILRLPPYHCQFNAIKLILGICKSYYDQWIGKDGYSDAAVFQMWEESLNQCSGEIWKKIILHTEKIIAEWWSREKVLDVMVELLIISLNGEDTDASDSQEEQF